MRNLRQITGLIIMASMGFVACNSGKNQRQHLATRCCKECLEAFNQSPVAVGPEGAKCGSFGTGKPLSGRCAKYFQKNKKMVADCD